MESGMGWIVLIPVVSIIGGMALAALGIYAFIRKREHEHRERLAMIERGLMPPSGPAQGASSRPEPFLPTHSDVWEVNTAREEDRAVRLRRGGFVVIALGVGLFLVVALTSGEVRAALGVGSFMIVLGAALFLSSYMGGSRRDYGPPRPSSGPGPNAGSGN